MELNERELATTLAGLRLAQSCAGLADMEHFTECAPLDDEEIDTLCEDLNCGDSPSNGGWRAMDHDGDPGRLIVADSETTLGGRPVDAVLVADCYPDSALDLATPPDYRANVDKILTAVNKLPKVLEILKKIEFAGYHSVCPFCDGIGIHLPTCKVAEAIRELSPDGVRQEDPEPYEESPEETGDWLCQKCGNTAQFRGIDETGCPGDECECEKDPCECEVELKQDFDVVDGEQKFQAFVGGGSGAEIGEYNRIECRCCEFVMWEDR